MIRLIVVVEGQTEEAFVKEVLKPHLDQRQIYTSVTIVGKLVARRRNNRERGGGHFRHWKRDIQYILENDTSGDLRVTTLFDLYGLPDDFPTIGLHERVSDSLHRCTLLEESLAAEFEDWRFLPYLQRHEFEALVLASLDALEDLLDAQEDVEGVRALRGAVGEIPPEDINEGSETAPSKRLFRSIPGYRKTLHGPLATSGAGLVSLRAQCSRFNSWVKALEEL